MQNPIQKIKQSTIIFEKPGILSRKLKNLTSSNYPTVEYFSLKLPHVSYLPMSTKGRAGFFYFVWTLSYLQKSKTPGFYTLVFYICIINKSRSKQKKKIPNTLFCRHY